jgi:sugar (pentulose or hexulose) kinase
LTPEPTLIGIDVGSTNFKAVAYDTAGRPIACAHVPTPTRYPRLGWAYFEPDEVWDQESTCGRQSLPRVTAQIVRWGPDRNVDSD